MYQPRIEDEHIRALYQSAKRLKIPMTRLVNTLLAHALVRLETGAENVHENAAPHYQRKRRQQASPAQRRNIHE
jgi:hypothetical protein